MKKPGSIQTPSSWLLEDAPPLLADTKMQLRLQQCLKLPFLRSLILAPTHTYVISSRRSQKGRSLQVFLTHVMLNYNRSSFQQVFVKIDHASSQFHQHNQFWSFSFFSEGWHYVVLLHYYSQFQNFVFLMLCNGCQLYFLCKSLRFPLTGAKNSEG